MLTDKLKEFLETKMEIIKFQILKRFAPLFGEIVGALLVIVSILFVLLMLNIAGALFLGQYLGNMVHGFLFVALFNTLLLFLILLLLGSKVKKEIGNFLLKSYIKSQRNED